MIQVVVLVFIVVFFEEVCCIQDTKKRTISDMSKSLGRAVRVASCDHSRVRVFVLLHCNGRASVEMS